MDKNKAEKAITYEDLYQQLGKLTPEQRQHKVIYVGEDKGGYIGELEVLSDDQVNPSGDGMEPRTEWITQVMAHEDYTKEDAESETIVAHKYQPLLVVVE